MGKAAKKAAAKKAPAAGAASGDAAATKVVAPAWVVDLVKAAGSFNKKPFAEPSEGMVKAHTGVPELEENMVKQIAEKQLDAMKCVMNIQSLPVGAWTVPSIAPPLARVVDAANYYFLEPDVTSLQQPGGGVPTLVRVTDQGLVPVSADEDRAAFWWALKLSHEKGDTSRVKALQVLGRRWLVQLVRDEGNRSFFFRDWQSREDAQMRANILALNPISRARRFLVLQQILEVAGKPHTCAAVAQAFKEEQLRYASPDSREATSCPVIAKHLAIIKRATNANVVDELEALAVVGGAVTTLSKWKSLEQLSAKCLTDKSYRSVVLGLHAQWIGVPSRQPAKCLEVDCSSQRFSEHCDAEDFKQALIDKMAADFKVEDSEPDAAQSKRLLNMYGSWELYHSSFKTETPDTTILGMVPSKVVSLATFLTELHEGSWSSTLHSMVKSTSGQFLSRVNHPPVLSRLRQLIQEWQAAPGASVDATADASELAAGPALQPEPQSGDADTATAGDPPDQAQVEDRKAAMREIQKYVFAVTDSPTPSASVECLRQKHVVTMELGGQALGVEGTPTRVWFYDPCVHGEPSEAYLAGHSGFARKPGVDGDHATRAAEIASTLFKEESDLFVACTAGQKKVVTALSKTLSKAGFAKQQTVTLVHGVEDLRKRHRCTSDNAQSDQKKSRVSVDWATWCNGPLEEVLIYGKCGADGKMVSFQPDRERVYLKSPGSDTTAMPFITNVPLPNFVDGNIRPLASTSVKKSIFSEMSLVSLHGDSGAATVVPKEPEEGDSPVPLFHHGRHEHMLIDVLHQVSARGVIDFTGGDGGMIRACLRQKSQ